MSYPNIKAELKRGSITYEQVAKELGMSVNNLSMKLNGRVTLTVDEAKSIQRAFCNEATLDYLLDEGEKQ